MFKNKKRFVEWLFLGKKLAVKNVSCYLKLQDGVLWFLLNPLPHHRNNHCRNKRFQ